MTTMLENIARAICKASDDDPDELVTHKPPPHDVAAFETGVAEGYRDDQECWYDHEGDRMWCWRRWRIYIPQAIAGLIALRATDLIVVPINPPVEPGPRYHAALLATIDEILAEAPGEGGFVSSRMRGIPNEKPTP